MSTITDSVVANSLNIPRVPADKETINTNAVADIVGMILAKYADEAERNFAIGKRFIEHAKWQKGNFEAISTNKSNGYQKGDFEALANDVRGKVRLYVPIKVESIRVADWARCHVLRELVGASITPESAAKLSMFEYQRLVGKALYFDAAALTGELTPGWLDMIRGVVADRAKLDNHGHPVRVTREDFENRIVATEKLAADAKAAKMDPIVAAAKAASDVVKKKAESVAKSVKDITTAIDTGIASGAVTPEAALALLEGVSKHHGKPLVAASIGFDPTTASVEDCVKLIDVMFAAGKFAEMKAMYSRLGSKLAIMEKATGEAGKSKSAPKAKAKSALLPETDEERRAGIAAQMKSNVSVPVAA